jgi:hypothetical protein
MARLAPLTSDEAVERGVGVGDVGLEHDARGHLVKLRLVEHADEGLDGELEIAVLLHVEVDEGAVGLGDPIERGQALGDPSERVVPGEHVEVGAQRRDLDGDVVHVGAAHT